MAKKFTLIMIVLLIASACVFVSCKNEPKDTGGNKETWSTTITETYKSDDVTYTATSTMVLMFDGKGNLTIIINVDTLLADGEDVTDEMAEGSGSRTMTGTYTATSETQGTISYTEEGSSKTITGTYAISGNKLLLSADGKSEMFIKK